MIKKKLRFILFRYILPFLGLFIVRVLSFTHRLRIVDSENEKDFLDTGRHLIYVSWHQRFFPGITFFATRKPIAIMISQSRDGEYMAHIVRILGWEPVRGSSTHGGREALESLKALAKSGWNIGHIVDGPKGPFGEVKAGLLRIAQTTGLPIVPTITSAEKKWSIGSWDRFMIPKPFSRVIIRFGKPVYVPEEPDDAGFEQKRLIIEQRLKDLYNETDLIWDDPEKIRKIFTPRLEFMKFSDILKR